MKEEQVLAYRYQGKRYDCGSKIGYLEPESVTMLGSQSTAA